MSPASPEPRTEHLRKPTARAIYSAAAELFFERGYEATSLREIADRVGIGVGSLYNHMSGKEEVLFNIMRGAMIELLEAVEQAMEGVSDPVQRVDAFLRASIGYHASHSQVTLIGNSELRSLGEEHHQQIVDLRRRYELILSHALQEAVDRGRIAVSDLQMTVFAGLAICSHVATWYRPGHRLSVDEIADGLVASYGPLVDAGRS